MPILNIAVLVTGNELLSGEITDTNTSTIADELSRYGYRLRCSLAVPDREKEISAALEYLIGQVKYVIVTGGLGSTGDDLTARSAARAVHRQLVLNDTALQMVRQWFSDRNRTMEPNNERQALLPQDAVPLFNPLGTAPGFYLRHEGCELFFLPGVPREMAAILRESVLPMLRRSLPDIGPVEQTTLSLFGLPEPRVERLIPYEQLADGVDVAFALDYPLVKLKLTAVGDNAATKIAQAERLLDDRLGDHIMARDSETPAGRVADLLTRAGLTLALAESCTGGLLASLLTSEPGASAFLERAGVTYADAAKRDWLQVPEQLLRHHGAVSEQCARAMAGGLRRATGVDLTLAITGIAGPDGGTADKPVGTVFLALANAEGVHVKRYQFHGDRGQIQRMSAYMALEWLRRFALQQLPTETGSQTRREQESLDRETKSS